MRPSEAACDFGLRLGSFLADREGLEVVSLNLFVDFLVEDKTFPHFAILGIFKLICLVSEVRCESAAGAGSRFRFLDCDFNVAFGTSTSSVVAWVMCEVDFGVPVSGRGVGAMTAVPSRTDWTVASVLGDTGDISKGWSLVEPMGNVLVNILGGRSAKGEASGRQVTESEIETLGR